MTDREKVIKGFTCCEIDASCANCPYFDSNTCITDLRNDVFELLKKQPEMLKEQEAVKPLKSKLSFTHGFDWEIWDCGCCGNQLRSFAKYCDQCGKAVKWNE